LPSKVTEREQGVMQMARSKLTWYKTEAKLILSDIRELKQSDIATEINESRQVVSYRLNKVYPEVLEDLIRILNMAGYEIERRE